MVIRVPHKHESITTIFMNFPITRSGLDSPVFAHESASPFSWNMNKINDHCRYHSFISLTIDFNLQ